MLFEQLGRALVSAFDQPLDLRINHLVGFCPAHCARGLPHAEIAFLAFLVLQGAKLVAHAPFGDHIARQIGGILDVRARSRGHFVMAEDQLFRHAATHADREVRMHLVAVVGIAVTLGQAHHHAQRTTTRDDGGLVDRVRRIFMDGNNRMARLVIGGHLFLVLGHDHRAPLRPHHHLVLGIFKFLHRDQPLVAARRQQGSLVHKVRQIRAGKAGRTARNRARVYVRRERHLLHVHTEDFLAPVNIGDRHHNLTVEPARTQQRRIKHIGAVGCRDDDDAFVCLKTVHFDEQLVQSLLALVIRIAKAMAARTANCVNLVDKDNARRVFLRLLEHVAHAACAHADKHLDKVRAGNGEERHARLARNRARQQRLTCAG